MVGARAGRARGPRPDRPGAHLSDLELAERAARAAGELLLERVLEPFRSEAAAFRVLLATIALFAAIIVIIVAARAIF